MELVLQKTINNTLVDGYADNAEAWFTRTQIGELLEYDRPQHAILNIHNRHKERLNLFSRWSQIETPSGVQDGYLYNIRGVFEICRWSKQPKADEIMDKLYDMAEEVIRKGYYTAIPETQLAEILIANMNDKDKLRHVIIPVMRDANVEQVELMARYMGVQPKDISQKLFGISEDNHRAKRMIDDWHRYNEGDYTTDDFPEPYNTAPSALVALDTAKRSQRSYGKFAKYCGAVHFNQAGYLMIIEIMRRKKFITPEVAREWEYDVRGIREEARI